MITIYEEEAYLERGLLPELDETYLPVLSEGNKGVPFPRCLAGLAQAAALTLGALFTHRGEAWRMWRGRGACA